MVKMGNKNTFIKVLLPVIVILITLVLIFNSGLTGKSVYSKCVDSDNTKYPLVTNVSEDESYFVNGNVTQGYTTVYDSCDGGKDGRIVTEVYCEKGTIRNSNSFGCPNGICKDGACVK